MTLLGDDDDAGGLSHLTGGAAALGKAELDTAPQGAAPFPRPGSAGADQGAAMDVDGGAPAPAAGGAEQPPAAGEGGQQEERADPLALLPPEMRQPPEGEGYPDIQASAGLAVMAAVGCSA